MSCISCLDGVRVYITALLGRGEGRGKAPVGLLVTNRVVPMPLAGTPHINTAREIEENVLRQLQRDGILAKKANGGVSYSVGNACQMFTIEEKKPRRLPAMEYSSDERILMANLIRTENLKKKGESSRKSEARRKRAAQKRQDAQDKKLEKLIVKQERLKNLGKRGK